MLDTYSLLLQSTEVINMLKLFKSTLVSRISPSYLFIVLMACLLVSSCSEQQPLSVLGENDVILAFGDSLTSGVGVSTIESYPSVLETLIGRRVVNAGVSGETTSQGVKRLKAVLQREQPSLVLLLEGGNDILRNVQEHTIKNNLIDMIEIIHSFGAEVVLIGVPPKKIVAFACADLYKEIEEEIKIIVECDFIADQLRDNRYKSDHIHFNKKGYARLAKMLNKLLEKNGAI